MFRKGFGLGFVGKKSLRRGKKHIVKGRPGERRKWVFLRFLVAIKKPRTTILRIDFEKNKVKSRLGSEMGDFWIFLKFLATTGGDGVVVG